MAQNRTIAGYFSSRTTAESAIDALKAAGFSRTHIGVVTRSGRYGAGTTRTEGHQHHEGIWERIKEFFTGDPVEPYAGEATGRPLDDREVAPRYSGEDIRQSLSGLSLSDEQSRYFQHRFGTGNEGAIVTVTAPGREREAEQILEQNGGDIGSSAATYEYSQNERTSETPVPEENIRLYGEVLRVHTERVNRGEVRLRKEVHTDTQTVEVPVTREELVIDRRPATGEQPTAADAASFQEQEIRVPLTEERAHVEKQPVVREEVHVGKKPVSDVERFEEEVRTEDLKVDRDVPGERKSA